VCIYQGEELALPEADVPFEKLQDPYGIAFWPNFKGRDGCRTPMPWTDGAQAGFTSGTPWLPVPPEHVALNVAGQEAAADSPLQRFRRFLAWRRGQPALLRGDIRFLDVPEPLLAFERVADGQRLLVAFNLSDAPHMATLSTPGRWKPDTGHGLVSGRLDADVLTMPGRGVFYAVAPD
jgi:alpha-glucosidase